MKAKTPVKVWKPRIREDIRSANEGAKILSGETEAIVSYRNKKWNVGELLQFLAIEIAELKKTACIPKVGCLFKGQRFLEDKYFRRLMELERYYAPRLDVTLFALQEEIEREAAEKEREKVLQEEEEE